MFHSQSYPPLPLHFVLLSRHHNISCRIDRICSDLDLSFNTKSSVIGALKSLTQDLDILKEIHDNLMENIIIFTVLISGFRDIFLQFVFIEMYHLGQKEYNSLGFWVTHKIPMTFLNL